MDFLWLGFGIFISITIWFYIAKKNDENRETERQERKSRIHHPKITTKSNQSIYDPDIKLGRNIRKRPERKTYEFSLDNSVTSEWQPNMRQFPPKSILSQSSFTQNTEPHTPSSFITSLRSDSPSPSVSPDSPESIQSIDPQPLNLLASPGFVHPVHQTTPFPNADIIRREFKQTEKPIIPFVADHMPMERDNLTRKRYTLDEEITDLKVKSSKKAKVDSNFSGYAQVEQQPRTRENVDSPRAQASKRRLSPTKPTWEGNQLNGQDSGMDGVGVRDSKRSKSEHQPIRRLAKRKATSSPFKVVPPSSKRKIIEGNTDGQENVNKKDAIVENKNENGKKRKKEGEEENTQGREKFGTLKRMSSVDSVVSLLGALQRTTSSSEVGTSSPLSKKRTAFLSPVKSATKDSNEEAPAKKRKSSMYSKVLETYPTPQKADGNIKIEQENERENERGREREKEREEENKKKMVRPASPSRSPAILGTPKGRLQIAGKRPGSSLKPKELVPDTNPSSSSTPLVGDKVKKEEGNIIIEEEVVVDRRVDALLQAAEKNAKEKEMKMLAEKQKLSKSAKLLKLPSSTNAAPSPTPTPTPTPISVVASAAGEENSFGTSLPATNAFGNNVNSAFGPPAETASSFGAFSSPSSAQPSAPAAAQQTLSFGAPSNSAFGSPAPSGEATFGTGTPTTSTFGNTVHTAPTAANSAFGSQPPSVQLPSATPSFGAPQSTTAATSFGSPAFGAQQSTNNAPPSFGAPQSTNTTPSFGAPQSSNAASSFGSPAATPSFGAPTANAGISAFGAPSAASTATPSFGASATPTNNTPSFGTPTPTPTNSGAVSFGAPSSSIPSFGAPTNSSSIPSFGAPTNSSSIPSFGAASSSFAAPQSTNNAPSFGAPATSTNNTPSFGAPSNSSTIPSFGAPTNAPSAAPSTSSFGAPATSSFGAPSSSAFGAPPSSSSSSFGAQPSAGQPFSFGSSSGTSSSSTSTSSSTASPFAFGGGSASSASTSQSSPVPFSFGAPKASSPQPFSSENGSGYSKPASSASEPLSGVAAALSEANNRNASSTGGRGVLRGRRRK